MQNLALFCGNEFRALTAASTCFIKTTPDSVLGHFFQGTGNTHAPSDRAKLRGRSGRLDKSNSGNGQWMENVAKFDC